MYGRKDPYEGENLREVLALVTNREINKRPPVPEAMPSTIATIMKECVDGHSAVRPTFEELGMRLKRIGMDSATPQDAPFAKYSRKNQENKADRLLQSVFPPHIAAALREGKKVEKEHHECVTIFFSDIVGFTSIAAKIDPQKVADLLDRLYSKFDDLTEEHEIFKVETIGDAYMAITNLVKDQKTDHVKRIVQFSKACIGAASCTLIDEEDPSLGYVEIRVGFHSGPVLSGVVGTRLPKYGVFGDTVNTASRMEVSTACTFAKSNPCFFCFSSSSLLHLTEQLQGHANPLLHGFRHLTPNPSSRDFPCASRSHSHQRKARNVDILGTA